MTNTGPSAPADHWDTQRRERSHRRTGPGGLTPRQHALAEDLHHRAMALRDASEEGLSICEAVRLAAVQLGLEQPGASDPGIP